MVITLTGATGFIGRRLLERFPPDQHSLIVLSRRNPELSPLVHYAHWEPTLAPPDPELLSRSDAVIHLAGEPIAQRWSPEVKARLADSRILGTRHLVQSLAAAAHRPRVLICASAVGYYGDRGEETLTESSAPGQGFLPDLCRAWEAEAAAAATLGIRVVSLRLGTVLGPGGGALAKLIPLFKAGLGGRLGSGRQWMSWIHLDDLIRLIETAIADDSARGPWNAVAPNPATNAEFTRALAGALHRPAFLPVPRFAVRLLYGEMSRILFDSQRVLPRAPLGAGFTFEYPRIADALAAIAG